MSYRVPDEAAESARWAMTSTKNWIAQTAKKAEVTIAHKGTSAYPGIRDLYRRASATPAATGCVMRTAPLRPSAAEWMLPPAVARSLEPPRDQ